MQNAGNVTLSGDRRGFGQIGGPDPRKSTDARGVLLGNKVVNNQPWTVYLVGVVSNRDIALVESLPGVDITRVTVDEAMAEEPWTVTADTALAQVAAVMAERKLGTAIVVDSGDADRVVGVFTTTDALRALAALA